MTASISSSQSHPTSDGRDRDLSLRSRFQNNVSTLACRVTSTPKAANHVPPRAPEADSTCAVQALVPRAAREAVRRSVVQAQIAEAGQAQAVVSGPQPAKDVHASPGRVALPFAELQDAKPQGRAAVLEQEPAVQTVRRDFRPPGAELRLDEFPSADSQAEQEQAARPAHPAGQGFQLCAPEAGRVAQLHRADPFSLRLPAPQQDPCAVLGPEFLHL